MDKKNIKYLILLFISFLLFNCSFFMPTSQKKYDNYFNKIKNENLEKKLNAKSKLTSLEISSGTLNPVFSADILTYNINFDCNTSYITLTPKSETDREKILINNVPVNSGTASQQVDLKYGFNTVNISVVSNDGNNKTDYVISIYKSNDDTTNWNKMFNTNTTFAEEYAYLIEVDSNNNVYSVGYGNNLISSSSGKDCWIKKFDSNGSEDIINWNKKIDNGIAYSLAVDSKNNVYVAGYGYNLANSNSGCDWWIKKFDANGNEDTVNWNKKISNSGFTYSSEKAYSVAIDKNDNVYVAGCGDYLVSNSSCMDWWIKKFDANGNEDIVNWNKKYSTSNETNVNESAHTIAIDSNNNVYVAGCGYNLITSSSGGDWWIKKFDANGNEDTANWNKKFNINGGECVYSLAIDSNNNVYAVGAGYNNASTSNSRDFWIKKFDSNGNEDTVNWNKLCNTGYLDETAYSVAVDKNNNVYVVGSYWWIKKFDTNGNDDTVNWNKMFSRYYFDCAYSVAIDKNNNIYVAGCGYNSSSGDDWWIKKFFPLD